MSWTPERIEILRDLWSQNIRVIEIAKTLKISRNAVIGKASRLRLPMRVRPGMRSTERKPRVAGPQLKKSIPFKLKEVPKAISPVSLADIKPHQCRWPIGDPKHDDFHMCGGQRVDSGPYCQGHTEVAYVRGAYKYT